MVSRALRVFPEARQDGEVDTLGQNDMAHPHSPQEVGLKVNVLCKVKLEKSYNVLASLLGRHCIRE